jgi:hypothetical protein
MCYAMLWCAVTVTVDGQKKEQLQGQGMGEEDQKRVEKVRRKENKAELEKVKKRREEREVGHHMVSRGCHRGLYPFILFNAMIFYISEPVSISWYSRFLVFFFFLLLLVLSNFNMISKFAC